MDSQDPTAYALGGDGSVTDPLYRRLNAWSNHGNMPLRMPFMTQVEDNLWHGGVETGLVLPDFIDHVVSLYPWEAYTAQHEPTSVLMVTMYDSLEQGFEQVDDIARWVNAARKTGTVLVHCQAGLNRSSLVVARALMLSGEVESGQEAIDLLRRRRDPAVLCNPVFEEWIRAHD